MVKAMSRVSPGSRPACWQRSAMCQPKASKVMALRQLPSVCLPVVSQLPDFASAQRRGIGIAARCGQDGKVRPVGCARRIQLPAPASASRACLSDARRSHQADSAGGEDRLGISHAERFQALCSSLKQLGSHLVKRKFGIEIERGLEVGEGQASRGRSHRDARAVQDARDGQREADGVRVSAKAGEQVGAGLERIQQMKCARWSGPSREPPRRSREITSAGRP